MAQHGRRQQRVGRRRSRPHPLDQAAADDQVRPRHPRLQQPVNRHARMPAPRRPHCDTLHRPAQSRCQIARGQARASLARSVSELAQQSRQSPAIGVLPQPLAAQSLARHSQGVQQIGQQRVLAIGHQRGQHGFRLGPPRGEGLPAAPIRPRAHHRAQRRQARRWPRPAQHPVKPPDILQPSRPPLSGAHQGMPQQRHQGHRRRPLAQNLRQQQDHPPGGGLGQGASGGVVRLDAPALQMRHNARRQPPVRRHQSHTPFGRFQRLAHQDGDGLRLFAGVRGFHQADCGQAAARLGQIHPPRRSSRRQEQVRNRHAARRRRR